MKVESSIGRRRKWIMAGGFAAFFITLWLLWNSPVVLPVKLFVVLLHELSHGLAAVLTGGSIQGIEVTAAEGGVCYCSGGSAFVTLSAGYLGSFLWGVALVALARRAARWSRWSVGFVGVAIVTASILFVNGFGFWFGLTFGAALLVSARFLPANANALILTALGLISVLYAILDIKSDVIDRPGAQSDAGMLAELTGVPTLVWGVLWIGVALWICARLIERYVREL